MGATHFSGPVISANGFSQSAGDSTVTGSLAVDNLKLDGNTLSSTSGAINVTPIAGSAVVIDTSVSIDGGAVDITGDLDVDNVNVNGNTISTTNADSNLTLSPNGTGGVVVGATGTAIKKIVSGTVSVTVSALADLAEVDLDLTITGVAAGDLVYINPTDAAAEAGLIYNSWVATTNTITVRVTNVKGAGLTGSTANWPYVWFDLT
jgi:hypothetical protein